MLIPRDGCECLQYLLIISYLKIPVDVCLCLGMRTNAQHVYGFLVMLWDDHKYLGFTATIITMIGISDCICYF